MQILRPLVDHRLELRQRDRPVHGRIALAEHAQIDPVQDDDLHRRGGYLTTTRPMRRRSVAVRAVRARRASHCSWSPASWPAPAAPRARARTTRSPHASTTHQRVVQALGAAVAHEAHGRRRDLPRADGGSRAARRPERGRVGRRASRPPWPPARASSARRVSGGVATINFRQSFASPAPKKRIRMRLAQLTFTATQFPNVHSVSLEIAGSRGHVDRGSARAGPHDAGALRPPAAGDRRPHPGDRRAPLADRAGDGHVRRVRGGDGRSRC